MTNTLATENAIEELARLPTLAHPTAAPDGSAVACYYDVSGRNEVHVVDVETGERTQWSDGDVPRSARWFLVWDADGERIFYHRDEGGDEQNDVYALSSDGSTEPVVELDGQVVIQGVGDDGRTLLVGSNRDGQMNLFRHDLVDDETTKLTDYELSVSSGNLSPDCDRIAYAANETDDLTNRDVYVAAVDGSNPRKLAIGETGAEAAPIEWSPDGDRLLVSDNTTDLGRVGVYDLESDEVTWYEDGQFEERAVTFLDDGSAVLANRTRDVRSVPIVYDLDSGTARELDLPDGVATLGMWGATTSALDDERIVVQHTTPTTRPEVLVYDLADDEYEVLVEAEYGPFDPSDFVDAEYVTFTSDGVPDTRAAAVEHDPADELDIDALFYDAGERPSPLLVTPHGGPRARDSKRFSLYTQVLASQGFSVLQVNYRGSSGRGREFVERLIDDWGGSEQGDVATGVEHVLETREWIDENRVAVFGGSYGGYSAYWQLVQYPDLYDAGIAWIGVTELEDMHENTFDHYRTGLIEKYLGTPQENPTLYEERSPVTHVENLDAPLLMAHGVNDNRVPVSQARIFRDALLEAGYVEGEDGDFEYEELSDEGHASSDQEQKLRTFRLLADFLDRRL
ncbi:S9 family peptidase [Halovivax gelatinilyticus]|uniref:S9 family peptidase n=1 Tax=Halovivax gelatinilyticus TaxID=2961597 RepID=UPI0020CA34DA|nr:prolyl oligopeptidase family serine peptidase [Halovivax gelatinilyticus]